MAEIQDGTAVAVQAEVQAEVFLRLAPMVVEAADLVRIMVLLALMVLFGILEEVVLGQVAVEEAEAVTALCRIDRQAAMAAQATPE